MLGVTRKICQFIFMLESVKNGVSKLAGMLQALPAASVIVMQGAGVSVAAGIPDFRTPETGFYSRVKAMGMSDPEAIFDIDLFRENPQPFYEVAHELLPGRYKPTAAHYFSTLLEKKGKLLRLYTQNIDGLERIGGVSEDRLVEAHGHFRSAHCAVCNKEFDIGVVIDHVKKQTPVFCKCGGWVKPDIVFFGQNLPDRMWELSETDFPKCKLLIVLGTSLKVFPFAGMVDWVTTGVPRYLINNEAAGPWSTDHPKPHDYFIKGDIQDVARGVINTAGWSEDYINISKS